MLKVIIVGGVAGGAGAYFVNTELGSPGTILYPPVCGWYWCVPGGAVPGTVVQASDSSTYVGGNLGIGLNFELSMGSQIYIEAKYHYIDSDPREATYVPIMVGDRW